MARIARVITEGMPYHITSEETGGNKLFFSDDDYRPILN